MIDPKYTAAGLNQGAQNTLVSHLGIEITDIGPEHVSGKMPVDHRTHQPYGLLHGGASVVLAETLGSIGADCSTPDTQYCVGLDINANHIRGIREGWVFGTATPLHKGKSTHVWEIKITDENNRLVCISRITMAVIDKK